MDDKKKDYEIVISPAEDEEYLKHIEIAPEEELQALFQKINEQMKALKEAAQ